MVRELCKKAKHPNRSETSWYENQKAIHIAEVQRMVDALVTSGAFCDVDITDEFMDELFMLATLCSFRRKCETGEYTFQLEGNHA